MSRPPCLVLGIVLTVLVIVDTWVFLSGYDSFLYRHVTPAELALQQAKLDQAKGCPR